jgi:GxxExxY protein
MLIADKISHGVIGAAIEVHKWLGPGLLESAYEECLARELQFRGFAFERQVPLSLRYKDMKLDCGFRMDFLVESTVVVELKCIEGILPVHEAQLLTYLRLSGKPVGLLINFNVSLLRDGILRRVLS